MAFFYQFLEKIGYTHPLHPVLTHLPVGLTIGAFLFALASMVFQKSGLLWTARHCILLALIALPPTALLGYWDWQHFYGGVPLFPIKMKLGLAALLLILLTVAGIFGTPEKASAKKAGVYCFFCLLVVAGIGYFGGELVYGNRTAAKEMPKGLAAKGAELFRQDCSACHFTDSTADKIGPGLKGLFARDRFPVSGVPVSEENFRKQLATPFGKMPSFADLSPEQVAALLAYVKTL